MQYICTRANAADSAYPASGSLNLSVVEELWHCNSSMFQIVCLFMK